MLVPEGQARGVCHRVLVWPIQGRRRPQPRDYGSPTEAVIDLQAAGWEGDALELLDTLTGLLL